MVETLKELNDVLDSLRAKGFEIPPNSAHGFRDPALGLERRLYVTISGQRVWEEDAIALDDGRISLKAIRGR
jgi:hypothetical protein